MPERMNIDEQWHAETSINDAVGESIHSIEINRGEVIIRLSKGLLYIDTWNGDAWYFTIDQNTDRTQDDTDSLET